ncbi:hypothetical protein [Nocardioides bruguierae]|uniref:hypothetical protein n=1 Tax=Nocardioides bruguierae TaxID=2945102 RepID=UPI002021E6D5|nr:hypothetical protein [Nocardioides bruguierae]MCL8023880.1 hypothetical protein [Nocardioides bruguierae]
MKKPQLRKPSLRAGLATVVATGLLATPLAVLAASPASAVEKERGGRCDGARFSLSVESDDGGYEVEADIDDAPRGSRWRVVMKQDGDRFVRTVARATADDDDDDRDGDVDIDRWRRNTNGTDTFVLRVNKVGTSGGCRTVVKVA